MTKTNEWLVRIAANTTNISERVERCLFRWAYNKTTKQIKSNIMDKMAKGYAPEREDMPNMGNSHGKAER